MKYAQLLMGLFVGVALGGTVVAATGTNQAGSAAPADAESIKKIVRQVILEEPQLIIQSVQKLQEGETAKRSQGAAEAMKNPELRAALFDDAGVGSIGPKDAKRVVVEFFDYNCPACKMQYREIDKLVKQDKSVRVLFREYPIFGPTSERNSRIGLAVVRVAPEKYFAFYEKMQSVQGRTGEKEALNFVKELGIDVEKVKAESEKPELAEMLTQNQKLGEALGVQGTPTLVVGDEVIPHAAEASEILQSFDKQKK